MMHWRRYGWTGLAWCALSLFPISAQEPEASAYRTYPLRHRAAEDVATQVREMFSGLAGDPQVGVDSERNQLVVHGSNEAHQLAKQLVTALDEAPAEPTRKNSSPAAEAGVYSRAEMELQSYVYPGDVEAAAVRLRERYAGVAQVRIATDPRTGRLIVAAPRRLQQQIARELGGASTTSTTASVPVSAVRRAPAEEPSPAETSAAAARSTPRRSARAAEAESDGPIEQPASPATRSANRPATPAKAAQEGLTSIALQHLTARQFEQRLQALLPHALQLSRGSQGDSTVVSLATAEGSVPIMLIDRQNEQVHFEGDQTTTAPWRRLMRAVDVSPDDAVQRTELIPLSNADPTRIQSVVARMNEALRDAGDGAILGGNANQQGLDPRWGGDLLAKIFLQDGSPLANESQAAPATPPAKPRPAATPPAATPPAATPPGAASDSATPPATTSGEASSGFLGPVQIEYIEGLDVIVLRGRKQDVERLQRIIAEIEQLSATTQPVIEIYPLKHVNDEAVVTLINELYEQILASRQGQVSIRALVNPNAILLIGRQENLTFIKQLIERLDQPADPQSEFVILRLKFASAVQAEQTIRNFFVNQPGSDTTPIAGLGVRPKVVADYRTNSLIVRSSPRDLEQIKRLIDNLDVETSETSFEIRVFRLRNALAADLAETLLGAIRGQSGTGGQTQQAPGAIPGGGGGGGGQTQSSALQPSAALQFRTIDQETGAILKSGIMDDVQVTADANINALIVRAPAESMELMQALITELDQIPDAEAVIKVFTVVNGDATNLTAVLQQLFGQQVTAGQGNAQFPFAFGQAGQAAAASTGEGSLVPLTFAVDVRTNSIIASGSPTDLTVVETLLLRLDESDIATRKLTVVRLKNAPALDVANSITTFLTSQRQLIQQQLLFNQAISPFEQIEREVIVVPEVVTNSLIVSATPRYYEEVLQVIKDLDFRPAMVMVQVVIAEVKVGNGFEFGTELGLQSSLLFDRGKAASPAQTLSPGFNFIDGDPGLPNSQDVRSSTIGGQGISTLGLGRISNLTSVGYGGLVLSAASDSVAGLIRALEQQDRLQVIARPQIMALNNQEAFVQVGADVARITGNQTTNAGFQQTIEDVPTGLILRVQPLINDDGVVVMNIDAERSRLGPLSDGTIIGSIETDTGTEPLIIQPIERTTAQTTISAKSGQTVVFAGLITDSKRAEQRGIPWLSKIPVLGRLFRYDAYESERTELLIVMTPHIIDDDEDYEVVKLFESQRMTWCLSDVVAIHGDVGLAGGPCLFCEDGIPTLYPDLDPTAASLHRLHSHPQSAEPTPATMPEYAPDGPPGVGPYSPGPYGPGDPNSSPIGPAGSPPIPGQGPPFSMGGPTGYGPGTEPAGVNASSRRQAPAPLLPVQGSGEPVWRTGTAPPLQNTGQTPPVGGVRPLPPPSGNTSGAAGPVLPAGYAPPAVPAPANTRYAMPNNQ